MKTVLITGAAGGIGTRLRKLLKGAYPELRLSDIKTPADLAPGDGRIVEVDVRRLGVHRTPTGDLVAVSPICTHMKCIVHWNRAEQSWDCPCHGNRFGPDGAVLEGPAIAPLEFTRLRQRKAA